MDTAVERHAPRQIHVLGFRVDDVSKHDIAHILRIDLRPPEPGALVQAPSNLTGICDRSVQSNIDAALNGTKNINDVIKAVEPRLWNMSTVMPILQDTTIVAAGPSVQNVGLTGAVPVGIVGDAGEWIKTGP